MQNVVEVNVAMKSIKSPRTLYIIYIHNLYVRDICIFFYKLEWLFHKDNIKSTLSMSSTNLIMTVMNMLDVDRGLSDKVKVCYFC